MDTDHFTARVHGLFLSRESAPEDFRIETGKDGTQRRQRNPMSGKKLTALHVRIAEIIRNWKQPESKQPEIAKASGCGTRTVQRAIQILSAFGLLSVQKRFLVAPTWRARLANVYHIMSASIHCTETLPCPANVSPPVRLARWIEKKREHASENAKQLALFEAAVAAATAPPGTTLQRQPAAELAAAPPRQRPTQSGPSSWFPRASFVTGEALDEMRKRAGIRTTRPVPA